MWAFQEAVLEEERVVPCLRLQLCRDLVFLWLLESLVAFLSLLQEWKVGCMGSGCGGCRVVVWLVRMFTPWLFGGWGLRIGFILGIS